MSPAGKPGAITTGSDLYWVEDRQAARLGDTVTYVDGSTTVIAEGDPGLIVAGRGVARLGYRLADGGRIVTGAAHVTSDDPYPGAGSVAEQVMLAARARALPFVAIDCERRALAASHNDAPEPDAPGPGTTEIHSDFADGGALSLFMDDASGFDAAAA